MSTKIEWTDETWNPVTGCTKVSVGCRNCYAERMAKRLAGRYGYPADEPFRVTLHPDRLEQPLRWRKPRMVFVPSMGDLFHDCVPVEFIGRVLNVIGTAKQHTFQLLTKRVRWMLAVMSAYYDTLGFAPFENLWLGVSAENQETADERIPLLLQTPAAVRFVSIEPMLGPVELGYMCLLCGDYYRFSELSNSEGECRSEVGCSGSDRWRGLDWVIVGGETGPGARPMDPDWARDIRDQCREAGTPFFFKQWGEWLPESQRTNEGLRILPTQFDGADKIWNVGKKAAGRLLDGREWNEMPAVLRWK